MRWILTLAIGLIGGSPALAGDLVWKHLTSEKGDLPVPGTSQQQTGALVADLDRDGRNDFVLSFRQKPPALVWYRRQATGWDRVVIEPAFLTVEAGGAAYDIDGDGDLDLVFGADWQGDTLWWWENPAPRFDAGTPWIRHTIKTDGAHQHHDQVFGDFLGTGRAQLAFWNQGAKTLFLATLPSEPRQATAWPRRVVVSAQSGGNAPYPEGLAAADIDGDGRADLLAGNAWYRFERDGAVRSTVVADIGGRIAAGRFQPGGPLQIVIAPGDGIGPLRWYECKREATDPHAWVGHALVDRPLVHGHSLQVADIDGDGHLDIFAAEMAQWHEGAAQPDNRDATAWIFFGDGMGHFRTTVFTKGVDFHEAQVADLDGDGDLDILAKPYTWRTPRVDVWLNEGPRPGR
jgi:hypothetical protein